MTDQAVEVEIKSLLGDETTASYFQHRLLTLRPLPQLVEESQQLNHYFVGDETALQQLGQQIQPHLDETQQTKLAQIIDQADQASVRTRKLNNTVLLVIKASIDDTTSSNGITRLEFEEPVSGLSLEKLDQLVLDSGYEYQAKWSRYRQLFAYGDDVKISLDKNAGYGYLAEFEKTVTDQAKVAAAQDELRQLMAQLDVEELPQDRLERMFEHYNQHWQDYYGTDKTFTIE